MPQKVTRSVSLSAYVPYEALLEAGEAMPSKAVASTRICPSNAAQPHVFVGRIGNPRQPYSPPNAPLRVHWSVSDEVAEKRAPAVSFQDQNHFVSMVVAKDKLTLVVGAAILLNTFSMAIETDCPDWPIWWHVNNLFLVFFVLEICARIGASRWNFFCPVTPEEKEIWGWNMFDLAIVILSVVDLWVKDILLAWLFPSAVVREEGGPMARYVMVLRMFRILRILRTLRLFRHSNELLILVNGIFHSMQLVVWIAIMMLMINIVFAIILTSMVGIHLDEYPEEVQEDIDVYWDGFLRSLVTLFQFLTMDDWSRITREVASTHPGYFLLFDFYISVQAFAMLSLLTGVISDHMAEVSQEVKVGEEGRKEKQMVNWLEQLQKRISYTCISHQGVNGTMIDRQGFEEILLEEKGTLKELGVFLDERDITHFWDYLDRNSNGLISWDDLKGGLIRLRGDLQPRDLLRMRCAAGRVLKLLPADEGPKICVDRLEQVQDCMDGVESCLAKMTEHIKGFLANVDSCEKP